MIQTVLEWYSNADSVGGIPTFQVEQSDLLLRNNIHTGIKSTQKCSAANSNRRVTMYFECLNNTPHN
jgi:hypothetical protein